MKLGMNEYVMGHYQSLPCYGSDRLNGRSSGDRWVRGNTVHLSDYAERDDRSKAARKAETNLRLRRLNSLRHEGK